MDITEGKEAGRVDISARLVNELRERTGAPLMDCKKALVASGGNLDQAEDHLRKQGLKSAEKRSGRSTAEGRVAVWIAPDKRSGLMLALTCETDFVANTDDFGRLLDELVAHCAEHRPASVESLLDQRLASRGTSVRDAIKSLSGKLGENMQVRELARLESGRGRVGAYVHHNKKIGALLALGAEAAPDKVDAFLKQLGMHVVFSKPLALARAEVPAEAVARERAVYSESEEVQRKPEAIRAKIVQGMLEKFYAGKVLTEQPWVHDQERTVGSALAEGLGPGARIEGFALIQVGA